MKRLTRFSKQNRKRMTSAELAMKKQLQRWGFKFRSQRPFGPYIVDFVLPDRMLVIEVDGSYHDGRAEYDAQRTAFLMMQGLTVLRIANEDVLNNRWEHLRKFIEAAPRREITDWKAAYGFAQY